MDAARRSHSATTLGKSSASHCGYFTIAQRRYAGYSIFHLAAINSLADGKNYCIAAVYSAGRDSDQARQDAENPAGRLALRTAGFYIHRGCGVIAQPAALAGTLESNMNQIPLVSLFQAGTKYMHQLHIKLSALTLLALAFLALSACSTPPPSQPPIAVAVAAPPPLPPIRIALALGGGAARGFAHIGVIKALEAQGIVPDIIVGTSAGSVVGALYAAGYNGFEIQQLSMEMDESQVSDWSMPNRGVIKGEALQYFINHAVKQRTLEKMPKTFAVVATDLRSGEMIVFRSGNTGMAVRASSAVPGVFQPVNINGHEYVDGGLVSPVPVRVARSLGADFVIAVDISDKPQNNKTESSIDVLLQTFNIMGQSISRNELAEADIVIRPVTPGINATDFKGRHHAVLQGEIAVAAVLPELKVKLTKKNENRLAATSLEGASKNAKF